MIKYICDRCGADVVEHERLNKYVGIEEYNKVSIRIHGHSEYNVCLCDKCAREWLLQCGTVIDKHKEG